MPLAFRRSVGYFALFLCLGLDMAVIGPTLSDLAGQTGSTLGEIGMVFFLGAGGVSLGTLLGGWTLDRTSGRLVLGAAQIISGSLLFLVPHVGWYVPLLALFVLKGIAGGVVGTGANTLLQWTHGAKAAPFVNALHFFFGLGAFLSPLLLGLMLSAGAAYSDVYTLLALFDISVGAAVLVRLSAPQAPQMGHREAGATGTHSSYLAPIVVAATLFLFFYVSAELTFGGWVYTYAVTLGLADPARAAYLTSLFWLAFTLGRLISIPVAVRISSAHVLVAALIGCTAFLGLLVVFAASPGVLWLAVAGVGFSMAPMWPSGYNLAVQSIHLTARLGAVIMLGDSIGGMVLPGLTGLFMERAGAAAMTKLVLASMVATAVAFGAIALFRARRRAALMVPISDPAASQAQGV
ncbi:MAG TPA: MFS transporter [Candidatus Limnocylindrales bacterium]|nr:MFS transporter [Candidatus Limnocylindrales bacterium]